MGVKCVRVCVCVCACVRACVRMRLHTYRLKVGVVVGVACNKTDSCNMAKLCRNTHTHTHTHYLIGHGLHNSSTICCWLLLIICACLASNKLTNKKTNLSEKCTPEHNEDYLNDKKLSVRQIYLTGTLIIVFASHLIS